MKNLIIYLLLIVLSGIIMTYLYNNEGENESIMNIIDKRDTKHYIIEYNNSTIVGDSIVVFYNKKNQIVGECKIKHLN